MDRYIHIYILSNPHFELILEILRFRQIFYNLLQSFLRCVIYLIYCCCLCLLLAEHSLSQASLADQSWSKWFVCWHSRQYVLFAWAVLPSMSLASVSYASIYPLHRGHFTENRFVGLFLLDFAVVVLFLELISSPQTSLNQISDLDSKLISL